MSKVSEFPFIEVEGSPYEIGVQIGTKAKKQIANCINVYRNALEKSFGIAWSDLKKYAQKYIKPIESYDGDIMEEVRGIAEGSENSIDDIVAINSRTELLGKGKEINDGCSSFGINREATLCKENIIGQNWDFYSKLRDCVIVLKIHQINKPDILMVAEAGFVGKIGLNSKGIGVCLNAIQTENKRLGVPTHFILRGILNSEGIVDAIGAITRAELANSANYLIGNNGDTIVDVEADPTDFDVLHDESGVLVHTNHILSKKLNGLKELLRFPHPDTYVRKMRLEKQLKQNIGVLTEDKIKEFLCDHEGYPDSICRHQNDLDPEHARVSTVSSIIMNLSKKEMQVASGNPCSHQYQLYRL